MDKPICYCFGVSESKIRAAIRKYGLTTTAEITDRCKAGAGCHGCWFELEEILQDEMRHRDADLPETSRPPPARFSSTG
jgi:NifU-like protein